MTRPAIRDSFDEEDASDDVDDEVFIRDGRNGYKMDEENGVKKPLMPPRRRHKYAKFASSANQEPKRRCKMFLIPCCYGVAALSVLLGLLAITVIMINYFSLPLSKIQFWIANSPQHSEKKIIPCNNFDVGDVWVQTFPKLTSETAVRLNDVNHDGILDIILGYGTGTDGRNVPDFVCALYFEREPPCLGGIVALDGRTGQTVWQHWTQRPVFSVDCSADLTADAVNDCLIGGKGGLLHVVNGHDGSLLWHLEDQLDNQQGEAVLDVYSAQFIPDIDDDGFVDVISAHTVSDISGASIKGHLIVISGKVGRILRMIEMPGGSESYYPPQLLIRPDGEKVILIGTGGTAAHSWGGLHAISLSQLAATDKVPFHTLVTSDSRGVMSAPVIVDINNDGTEDIIVSLFNSTVVAIDGKGFTILWNYTFPNSQTFSPPTPGYFNDDNVPDFLVKYQNGPDFPVYYFSQMNILDGKTGLPMLSHPYIDSVGSQMGGLSISMEGFGSDWFLYWTANCVGHEGSQSSYSFAKGSSIVSQSQADICRLRFNSTMTATLWALNRYIDAPGFAIYSTDGREAVEYNNTEGALDAAGRYLATHPDFWTKFGAQENLMKPTNTQGFPTDDIKTAGRSPPSFESTVLKEDRSRSPLGPLSQISRGRNGKGGEAEELEEPDYSRMQPHQVGKHHKPYSSISGSRNWHLEDASKNYGSLYEPPRSPDNLDQDYENPPRLGTEFNSYLTDARNEREGAQQAAPNFDDIFNDQLRSGRRLKRTSREITKLVKKAVAKLNDVQSSNGDSNGSKNTSGPLPIVKGIYPITSTGTLAPALSGSGIDLVLVSYWIPPSDSVQILTEKDIECVKQGIARATDNDKYANMDQESLELAVTTECLYQRFTTSTSTESASPSASRLEPHPGFTAKIVAESSSTYNALNLRLGQLTVYRFNLQCKCSNSQLKEGLCTNILSFSSQGWPSHMGHDGKGYFNPRN